ncbi:CPBP family intramembrane glutamic endopeptidase [Halalkalibacter sp. APA_J-10(15)]|uniref:CPBP family intramembrane glutamic endopeptidase n=1 Tax=Halalkalibacter sp. APA_J-10(15) TaxID=2933805 RepID=UPI001FF62155|nr:type II CAAX endopeptidase family protein [Halalkalibacter sp. APA_J-10(15)]MCK0472748.1 CPBP family intramembrane metalloprotease [Halalkalibacter sp. APA_J-10(15)]
MNNLYRICVFLFLVVLSYVPFVLNEVLFVIVAILFFPLTHYLVRLVGYGGLNQLGLRFHKRWGRNLALGFIVGLSFNLVLFVVIYLFMGNRIQGVISVNEMLVVIVFALVTTSYTAFAEELLMRGFIYRSLQGLFTIKFILLFSIVLFVAYHLPNWGLPLPYWIRYALMGAVFFIVMWKSGSLWMSIGLHWGGNFMFYLLLTSHGLFPLSTVLFTQDSLKGWLGVVAALLLLMTIIIFLKLSKGNRNVEKGLSNPLPLP